MHQGFVILFHSNYEKDHFDFMLETHDTLATWSFETNPCRLETGECITGQKIQDHRKDYLSLEGAISNDRGEVRQVARGTFLAQRQTPQQWTFSLASESIGGQWELTLSSDQTEPQTIWTLHKL